MSTTDLWTLVSMVGLCPTSVVGEKSMIVVSGVVGVASASVVVVSVAVSVVVASFVMWRLLNTHALALHHHCVEFIGQSS